MNQQRKDKQKVIGEIFDEARIKSFLAYQPPEGVNADYHLLEKAYRGMLAESFATFVKFFLEEGRDINARNPQGKTMLEEMKTHRLADDYIAVMEKNGAG
ncbi:MAG: aminopeptidase [Gammaproteobacteria bacterium BRH_c0]|nr:MAG: aminopeptidase [Gammaproteobacteria bacterium BRH_c0]